MQHSASPRGGSASVPASGEVAGTACCDCLLVAFVEPASLVSGLPQPIRESPAAAAAAQRRARSRSWSAIAWRGCLARARAQRPPRNGLPPPRWRRASKGALSRCAVAAPRSVCRTEIGAEIGKGPPHPLSSTVAPFRAWRGSRCAVGGPTRDRNRSLLVDDGYPRWASTASAPAAGRAGYTFVGAGGWLKDDSEIPDLLPRSRAQPEARPASAKGGSASPGAASPGAAVPARAPPVRAPELDLD